MLSSGSTEIWFQPELPGLYILHQEMVIFGIFSYCFCTEYSNSSPNRDLGLTQFWVRDKKIRIYTIISLLIHEELMELEVAPFNQNTNAINPNT